MGALVRKSFVCFGLMMLLALVLGLFGCGDVYKNMKISVDTTEIVLYLNGQGEEEPSSRQITATISGVKDKNVSKAVQVVFDDERIASADNEHITYSGDTATVTIHASAPGTTNMRVKSLDNSQRVSSEYIKVTVISKVESLDVSNVVASVPRGGTLDLALLEGINFSPSITSETDLEFYFPTESGAGTNANVFGQIVDKHILVVSPTATDGFCSVLVKSVKLGEFNPNSPLQKTFSVLIYSDFSSDDITLYKYSKKSAKYEEVEDDLVMMSNYVDKSAIPAEVTPSVDEQVMLTVKGGVSEVLKNYYTFDIAENESTEKGIVKVDTNITDVPSEFKLTPNRTGETTLSLVVKIERNGKVYVQKERRINIIVKTIVKKIEITTDEQTVMYGLDEEITEYAAVGVFERTNYKGISGTKITATTAPARVVNPRYKILLSDGVLSDGAVILRKDFQDFIKISDGNQLVNYGEEGIEFESGSTFYVSYESSMLSDIEAKNLSEFSLFVVSNYDEGLKRIVAEIKCSVFKSLENFGFVGDKTEYLSENDQVLEISFCANNNINLDLLNVLYDNTMFDLLGVEYKVEDSGEGPVENKKIAIALFRTKKLGETTISIVEKYTNNDITAKVFVVVPTENVYLTVNQAANEGVGAVENEMEGTISKVKVVKVQSGITFYFNINTTTENATLDENISFVFDGDSSLILRENVTSDLTRKTIKVATNANNYASDINKENTYAFLYVTIDFYSYESGILVKKSKTEEVKVGTYKRLVEFSFGNKAKTKVVEVYDNNHISTQNKEKANVGYSEIVPFFEKPENSSYDYYLEKLYFPDGALDTDVWHIEYIGKGEFDGRISMSEFKGIKIYATGADKFEEQNRQIKIQFTIKEFSTSYDIVCYVNALLPTPQIEDVDISDSELYLEDWASDYNTAEIRTSVSPVNVFDSNLSYVVVKDIVGTKYVTKVYDKVLTGLETRFNGASAVAVEMKNGKVVLKCESAAASGEQYYVVVLPSYLLNFELSDFESEDLYKQKVLEVLDENLVASDQIGLCKEILINVANGSLENPYKIEKFADLKNMLSDNLVNTSSKYFVLTRDIEFDEEDWVPQTLKANIFVQDGSYLISGITKPIFSTIESDASFSNITLSYDDINISANEFGLLALENKGEISYVSVEPSYTSGAVSQILVTQLDKDKDGNVLSAPMFVGGLVAKNSGSIQNSYGELNIVVELVSTEFDAKVGGFVGVNDGEIKVIEKSGKLNTHSINSSIEVKVPTKTSDPQVGEYYFDGNKYVEIEDVSSLPTDIIIYQATDKSFVGGLVGENNGVIDSSSAIEKLTNINVFTEISAPLCDNVGGIAGKNTAVIKGVMVSPKLEARNSVGGAVGLNTVLNMTSDLWTAYQVGLRYVLVEFYNNRADKTSVYANENVGGLIGEDQSGFINSCYATSYVTNLEVDIEGNGFLGDIYANNNIGGLVGMGQNTNISQSFASVSIGLNNKSNKIDEHSATIYGAAGGIIGYYVVSNGGAQISKSYAINNFGTLKEGLLSNKMGGLVGILNLVSSSADVLYQCYAVTNGGALTYLDEGNNPHYACFQAFAHVLRNGTYSAIIDDSSANSTVCSDCFYADVSALSGSSSKAHLNIKTKGEMQVPSTYTDNHFTSDDWKIIDTANSGFPILKVKLNGSGNRFELYNAQIGSVAIEEYYSDESFAGILPKFAEFQEGKILVILEMLCHRQVVDGEEIITWDTLTLKDLLSLRLEEGIKAENFEIKSSDSGIVQIVENTNEDESRFELKFNKTGIVKLTIQARQNSAISKTIQICVVGGFSDYSISNDNLFIAKGGSNSSIITFNQNSKMFYNNKNLVKLKVTKSTELNEVGTEVEVEPPVANVSVGEKNFVSNELDLDLTTNKTIMLTGIGEAGTTNEISLIPYLTIGFYTDIGTLESYNLLLKPFGDGGNLVTEQTLKTKMSFKTITTTMFEGVTNLELNEENAALQNSGRLDVELSIASDAITETQVQTSIKDDLKIIVVKQVFNETTKQYEEKEYLVRIYWDSSEMWLCEKVGENDGRAIYSETASEVVLFSSIVRDSEGKMIVSFSLEHEKNRMTEDETEQWSFSYENRDGSVKSANLNVLWSPSSIENVEVLHYINKTEYADAGQFATVGADQATNKIASGSMGVLKIRITQEYSDYDYIIVKGKSSVDEISFARLVESENDAGEPKLVSDLGQYSQSLIEGGIKLYNLFKAYSDDEFSVDESDRKFVIDEQTGRKIFVDDSGVMFFIDESGRTIYNLNNGVFYVSTLTSVGLDENTQFLIDVYAYKITENGDELVYSTEERGETTTLFSAFAPYVFLSVDEKAARTTDGGLLARGTSLGINMVGVLQQSSLEVRLGGYVLSQSSEEEPLKDCKITWEEEGVYSTKQTILNFVSSLSVYAGIDSLAANSEGRLTLTVTVISPGFSTTTSIYLYLVDYLITEIGVEGVDSDGIYTIKIQDDYKPLKLKVSTGFGEFLLTSDKYANLSAALDLAGIKEGDAAYESFKTLYGNVVTKITDKIKELNALGTRTGQSSATIWLYRNSNLNVSSNSYEYFYLKVDNKYKNNNIVTIRGKEEANIVLSVALHRGAKLSQDGNYYELIVQSTSITESYLDVSGGDYNYEFTIHFSNESSSTLPIPVSTEQELREMVPGGHYILTKDITVTNWVPLTTNIGSLDGNGYRIIIKNFNITTTNSNGAPLNTLNAGLFESISTYYDTKTETTEPTRLMNIVLDISQTIVVDLGEVNSVNFGFLVGKNDGGVIYNCEIVSGVSDKKAKLNIDSDVDVELIAEATTLYEKIAGGSGYNETTLGDFIEYKEFYHLLQFDSTKVKDLDEGTYTFIVEDGEEVEGVDAIRYDAFKVLFYKYERYIEIVGTQGNMLKLANGDVVSLFSDGAAAEGFDKGVIYNTLASVRVPFQKDGAYPTEDQVLKDYSSGGYYVYKTSYVELTNENLSLFNYEAWEKVFEEEFAKYSFGAYANDVLSKINLTKDTTSVFIVSNAEVTNSMDVNIGGLVGLNNGYISNSRIGRLENITTKMSASRLGVDENGDGIVDALMQEYGISLFGSGKLGGLVSVNNGVVASSYFANSNLVNMKEITNNRNIITGGLVAINKGRVNTSYVESNRQDITFSLTDTDNIEKENKKIIITKGKFKIGSESFWYHNEETKSGGIVVSTTASIYDALDENKLADVDLGRNKFVLLGVEYTVVYDDDNKNYTLNYVRRTQNNIYFSGEIGGLVHTNDGQIENSYTNIGLKSTLSVGGFVYNNRQTESSIKYCYSVCAIDNENVINGPFIGANKANEVYNSGVVENSYYLIDDAIKQNIQEPASALDKTHFCSSNSLLLGFVFASVESDSEGETIQKDGVWYLDEEAAFEGPKLLEANNLAYSRREAVLDESEKEKGIFVYTNTTFGEEENPIIVYSTASFDAIDVKVDSKVYQVTKNVRIVADIDFGEESPTLGGDLSSKFTLSGMTLNGNGMRLKDINIVAADEDLQLDFLGLFKSVANKAVVSNLELVISKFEGNMTKCVGALTGFVSDAFINNIKVSGKDESVEVTGRHLVGGAVGHIYGSNAKVANIECAISVNSTLDAIDAPSVQIMEEKADDYNMGIGNINNISYAGGVVGGVVSGTRTYKEPVIVNCSVKGNFKMQAQIVGGLVGFVSSNSAISECKLILNANGLAGQKIQAGSIAGGLVGENRGEVSFCYISLDDKTQSASDIKFSRDGLTDEQSGTTSLFTGDPKVIGGMVGLNIGSLSADDNKYTGAIRFSYSRVKVENENAMAAGGLVGMAVASTNEIENLGALATIINSTYTRKYKNTVDGTSVTSYIEESSGTSTLRQSLFLHGVYTTGSVKAQKVAGGMVGVATALISTMKSESQYASVVSLPSEVQVVQTEGNIYNGIVVGKANYEAKRTTNDGTKYVYFTQNGGKETVSGVSTISIDSQRNLVGHIANSALYENSFYKEVTATETITYYSLFEVMNSLRNMQLAFGYMWDPESNYAVDGTQTNYILPKLSTGLTVVSNTISTVEEYLKAVQGGERGNYVISVEKLEFDFDRTITLQGITQTIGYWFETQYGENGPSGVITGAPQRSGENVKIVVKNNTSGISFFGGMVQDLKVSNIDFEFINESISETEFAHISVEPDLDDLAFARGIYWGLLANSVSSCEFRNMTIDGNSIEINPNKFLAVGGIVGNSKKSTYYNVSVKGINIVQTNYQVKDAVLYVGGVIGKSVSDALDGVNVNDFEAINIGATQQEIEEIYVGGVAGYASTFMFNYKQANADISRIEKAKITLTTDAAHTYVGGVAGLVTGPQQSHINKVNVIKLNMNVTSENETNVGGLCGQINNTSVQNGFVSPEASTGSLIFVDVDKIDSVCVGGGIGKSLCSVMPQNTSLQTNGEISGNAIDCSVVVYVADETENDSHIYAGGLLGYMSLNDNSTQNINPSADAVELFTQNQTSGQVSVYGQKHKTAYVAGMFGKVETTLTRPASSEFVGKNSIAISRSSNNASVYVKDITKAYVGGICAYSDVILKLVANYASLTNDYTPAPSEVLTSYFSYIGGIVGKTTGRIETCLSLGAIFEPNYVESVDGQISHAQAIAALMVKGNGEVDNLLYAYCYYSSDFTGINQTTGHISADSNLTANKVLYGSEIKGLEDFMDSNTSYSNDSISLMRLRGLKNPIIVKKITSFGSFEENIVFEKRIVLQPEPSLVEMVISVYANNVYVADTINNASFDVETTVDISSLHNISIIGNNCVFTTKGCSLFDVIPSRVMVSSIKVVSKNGSSYAIDVSDDFGLLAVTNNGVISNCMAGVLPKQGQVSDADINVKSLSEGITGKTAGVSEKEILTINISSSANNKSIGALVGVNNKVVVNSLSYADINVNTSNTVNVSNLVGHNNFKVSYSYALGKLNLNMEANSGDSSIGEVIGKTGPNNVRYVSQLFGYVDVYCKQSNYKVGGVVGGNNSSNTSMFFVQEMSRTPVNVVRDGSNEGTGAVIISAYAIYKPEIISNVDANFWFTGFGKEEDGITNIDYKYLYGLYTLNIHKNKVLTYRLGNYEIENYAELNLMNHKYDNNSFVFVRDLMITTKLLSTMPNSETAGFNSNNNLTIDGAGHYLFANKLINSGFGASNTYTAFNMQLNSGSVMKNIVFKFGETSIETTGSATIAPLIRQINGGTATNCAVIGDIDVITTGGSFGGLCESINVGGKLEKSWSGVNLTIKKATSGFNVGGLCNTIDGSNRSLITECFVDASIKIGGPSSPASDIKGKFYVGGLVGKLEGTDASSTNIKCCYVSHNSTISTEYFNDGSNRELFMGEFVGSLSYQSSSNRHVLDYCIFEGDFILEDSNIGIQENISGDNFVGSLLPKRIAYDNNGDKIINSMLAIGFISGATQSIQWQAESDRLFAKVLSIYATIMYGYDFVRPAGKHFVTMVSLYQGEFDKDQFLLEAKDTSNNSIFEVGNQNVNSYPYLVNVTPSDRRDARYSA